MTESLAVRTEEAATISTPSVEFICIGIAAVSFLSTELLISSGRGSRLVKSEKAFNATDSVTATLYTALGVLYSPFAILSSISSNLSEPDTSWR